MEINLQITQKQKAFIETTTFEVLYGGAAGGGKSYGQLIDALLYALKHEGSKQLILRRTYGDLERSLILEHMKIYPRGVYKYNQSSHRGEFLNGSIIEFGYCDNEHDVYRYQGAEYDIIRFDELTHFSESMYLYLFSRVRGANDYPKAIKSSTNPGGFGHTWVKRRFIDIGPVNEVNKIQISADNTQERIFIPSFAMENKFLMEKDPDYLKRLDNLDDKSRKALLYGDWDITDGQFFYDFKRDKHICKPFEPPREWRRYVSIDYGMDMLAVLWFAIDCNKNVIVYRELYEGKDNGKGADGKGHIISDAAKRIIECTGASEKIYAYLAPPDLWNRRQDTGKSAVDIFYENGIYLSKTSNDRKAGWFSVREWLRLQTCEQTGEKDTVPKLKIFDVCVNLIRCLGEIQYNDKSYEDVATEPHELTHIVDALRGFCVHHTYPTQTEAEKDALTKNFNFKASKTSMSALGEGDELTVI